jgi:subtilisin-like proprotein convertase family protein
MRNIYLRPAAWAAVLIFFCLPILTTAQTAPVLELPVLDNAALQAEEMSLAAPGRPARFAVTHEVDIRPQTHGAWTERNGTSTWRLGLRSAGAYSLNLGFTEYYLPPGAELSLSHVKDGEKIGPFTAADNELHKQLWTPIIPGDQLLIELVVPTAQRDLVQLWLTKINHDFGGMGLVLSGSCNLDVICGEADGWSIVDQYRDIIQSAAIYSLNGNVTCSGALINNARQDCTPYFLTANHCGVSSGSAPSMVVYWNYANSTCRQPNSTASGNNGNGDFNLFNSGATLRASFATSDLILVELDDPVVGAANAFFAGWDRRATPPSDTVIAIHHPALEEKRISFSFQPTFRVNGISDSPDPEGTHLTVPFWDIGTTEGGSSGSPVFDRFKRIRGQLHGGAASCSNVDFDSYGFLFRSWTGGGTPETRLSDWLDPDGTGVEFIDGRSALACSQAVAAEPLTQRLCAGESTVYTLLVGGGYTDLVNLAAEALPPGVTATFSQNDVAPGASLTLTLTTQASTPGGTFAIPVAISSGDNEQELTLELVVDGGTLSPPPLILPAENATQQGLSINLTWQTVDQATGYAYEISADANFNEIIAAGSTAAVSAGVGNLTAETTYYWRVRSENTCGLGDWSVTRQFTTGTVSCAAIPASGLPRSIPDNSSTVSTIEVTLDAVISEVNVNNLRIDHTYIGDLRVQLTSPAGTTVTLFDRIGFPESPFGCGGEDLLLDLSNNAGLSATELENTCNDSGFGVQGAYQPLESFLAFAGEPTEGIWTLRVFDGASSDVGRLISWELDLCSTLPVSDLSLDLVNAPAAACVSTPVDIVLGVGPDFGDDFTTSILLNDNNFIGFVSSFDSENRQLTISIPNLIAFQPGQNELQVVLTSNDEDANGITLSIDRLDPPLLPVLVSPSVGATVLPAQSITYSWQAAAGAEAYIIQFSQDENFSTLLSEATVTETTYVGQPPVAMDRYFWRVISTNSCGDGISAARSVTVDPNATIDLAGGTVELSPNPTFGSLLLTTSANWNETIRYRLVGAGGRLLQQGVIPAGARRYPLDLSAVPAGVYWLELRTDQARGVSKVVKLR